MGFEVVTVVGGEPDSAIDYAAVVERSMAWPMLASSARYDDLTRSNASSLVSAMSSPSLRPVIAWELDPVRFGFEGGPFSFMIADGPVDEHNQPLLLQPALAAAARNQTPIDESRLNHQVTLISGAVPTELPQLMLNIADAVSDQLDQPLLLAEVVGEKLFTPASGWIDIAPEDWPVDAERMREIWRRNYESLRGN